MTKSKKIMLVIAIVIIVALMVVAGITKGASRTIACPDGCDEGWVACSDCVCPECGADEEKMATCEVCEKDGLIDDCYTCRDTRTVHCGTCGNETTVRASAWALLPPIIAIGLALITKEVYSSLFVGIVAGAILNSNFSFTGTLDAVVNDGLISAVTGTAGIFIFLIELGIIVALINRAGGSAAFGRWAQKHIKTRVGAQLATFVLGVLIFVDDYFNCLTVGSVMRPVTDSKRISRAKLSYLIDATAAPICMIAPISSWAAAVSNYAPDGEGLSLFIKAIPFNFYSVLTLVFIIAIVLMKFDYGPMKLHEFNAIEKGDLYTSGDKNEVPEVVSNKAKNSLADLIVPVAVLIVSCVLGLVYVGGLFDGESFIDSFANTDATVGLPLGGLVALVIILAYMLIRRTMSFKESMASIPQGFIAMVPAILILTFATALKNMTSSLGADFFVGELMEGSNLGMLLPAIIFLVACGLAFATGTSWGTFGILIPIVIAIFPEGGVIQIIGMSACLAGSVCGDHCSPISDTTIMSSAGGQCNHLNHVSTQMPYALTVAGISFVMFLVSGLINEFITKSFAINAAVSLTLGVVLTVGTLLVIKLITKNKAVK